MSELKPRLPLAALLSLLLCLAAAAPAAPRVLQGTKWVDYVRGTRGADTIVLRVGDDQAYGGRGADLILGGRGDDRLRGEQGPDRLLGGGDRDYLHGGRGPDALRGQQGADVLDARDGRLDRVIHGGAGRDVCLVDRGERRRARGCEIVLMPGDPSASHAIGLWRPGRGDTCPRWLHDSYSVVGPDGKLYPSWHPPFTGNPATGRTCSFGHEHGRDPRGSDLHAWVGSHLAAPGRAGRAGVPFGLAAEALDSYAAANPGVPTRHEDHVGHKVEWENDVELERTVGGERVGIGVVCDFLTKIHQGSHSPDALGNNVHELLYAVRCDDGTELIATKLVSFGQPNSFTRSCDKSTVLGAGTAHDYPAGGGMRLVPDRACIEEHLLVPEGQFSQFSLGLYENWLSSNHLRTAGGEELAYFDPHFAVFNPSRYALESPAGAIGRVIDVCWEEDPPGERARGGYCEQAAGEQPPPFDSPISGFDGGHREVYFNQTAIDNEGGPRRWYTDPYGGNASTKPFPGGVCQLVAPVDNERGFPLESQAFGAGRDYGARGVHAPN